MSFSGQNSEITHCFAYMDSQHTEWASARNGGILVRVLLIPENNLKQQQSVLLNLQPCLWGWYCCLQNILVLCILCTKCITLMYQKQSFN